ncbi:unnamed protein product [Pseudo-nitzschia multistriata]|uniref:Uncharacterized protein n=1 Tax=Pseudo-nitzschia multistriata TaxID=183589 RepID=A0A448ZII1_9STRA|nr:unnamed protein product [Pseudo-nitzschia multistriata]
MIWKGIKTPISMFVYSTALPIIFPALISAFATTTTNTNMIPKLRGVVFDMDDTLVLANLDIPEMYKKVFGKDPLNREDFDILKEIKALECPEEQARAHRIIEEMEEESRQQMTLMPGCVELLTWLSAHNIPTALVTRNTRKTTHMFSERLQAIQQEKGRRGHGDLDLSFQKIIARDDMGSDNTPIPPKPDPAAMKIIARESFDIKNEKDLPFPEILMVGDNVANDVGFGKNAGACTALLASDEKYADAADIFVEKLTELPRKIWNHFEIDGSLGNTPEANQLPLHGSPPPTPQSKLCKAVVDNDVATVRTMLGDLSLDEITAADEENKNTALIWAAEIGNLELTRLILDTVVAKLSEDENYRKEERLLSFVNHRGFLGATALNRAARRGHTHIVDSLLSPKDCEVASCFDADVPNDKLQHPLHFAAFKKHPETVASLLQCGANPWVLDRKGRTPLEDTSCETCQSLLKKAML